MEDIGSSHSNRETISYGCECKRCEEIGHDQCKCCKSIIDAFLKMIYHTNFLPWP